MRLAFLPRGIDGLFLPAVEGIETVALVMPGSPDEAWMRALLPADRVVTSARDRPDLGPYPSTGDLLEATGAGEALVDAGVDAFFPSAPCTPLLASWAARHGLRLVMSDLAHQSKLEDKIAFDALLRRAGLPRPRGGAVTLGRGAWPVRGRAVVQEPRSSGGDGTRFVRSRADIDALVARGALERGERYLVRERVDGRPLGATVFVAPGLVALSALRLQAYHPRDDDGGPGAFAGVQWLASADLSARARSRVEAALFGVGERLVARRFFGFANVDLMLDRRDRALILECNPRMSAATPELLRSPELASGLDTGARFLEGFLRTRAWRRAFERLGLPTTTSRPASLDVVLHGARGVVAGTLPSGVYTRRGAALDYVGPDLRALEAGKIAIVVMAREGQACERGDTLATAMSTEALYDDDGALLPVARALLARLRFGHEEPPR